jgi:hypothetical protein
MTAHAEKRIIEAIEAADEFQEPPSPAISAERQRLLIEDCNPDRTVAGLRDILAAVGGLYDRGVPVRLAFDQMQCGTVAQVMTADGLVLLAHSACRPFVIKAKKDGTLCEADARLPRSFAVMYLDWRGEWRLPVLNGIATAPLLQEDGTINSAEGYDPASGMWCESVPDLTALVPERPTKADAVSALRLIRETFKTFCFADAETIDDAAAGVPVVDVGKAPGRDESSFLAALLTAVCRPSLHLAPGVLLRAAPMSGAGAGKGLLARCICIIAFGREPHAVTAGATAEELEKRIAAELIEGSPALFLDNLNNTAFKSNLLASAITERPARVRLLGKSQMVPLNASAFVILTGNGLTVSEDLARRFVAVDFDPRTEDPEARPFTTDIRAEVTVRRNELLAALQRTRAADRGMRPTTAAVRWSRCCPGSQSRRTRSRTSSASTARRCASTTRRNCNAVRRRSRRSSSETCSSSPVAATERRSRRSCSPCNAGSDGPSPAPTGSSASGKADRWFPTCRCSRIRLTGLSASSISSAFRTSKVSRRLPSRPASGLDLLEGPSKESESSAEPPQIETSSDQDQRK